MPSHCPRGVPKGMASLPRTGPFPRAFFEELLEQDPDITLFELRDAPAAAEGVRVYHASVASLLYRLGFT